MQNLSMEVEILLENGTCRKSRFSKEWFDYLKPYSAKRV
jgi:hypothetical protein